MVPLCLTPCPKIDSDWRQKHNHRSAGRREKGRCTWPRDTSRRPRASEKTAVNCEGFCVMEKPRQKGQMLTTAWGQTPARCTQGPTSSREQDPTDQEEQNQRPNRHWQGRTESTLLRQRNGQRPEAEQYFLTRPVLVRGGKGRRDSGHCPSAASLLLGSKFPHPTWASRPGSHSAPSPVPPPVPYPQRVTVSPSPMC